jgi:hypothetical protein
MRRAVAAIAAAAMAALASPAQADRASDFERALRALFDQVDANGDGLIKDPEIRRFADRTFTALDTDGDGRLTHAEFQRFDFGLRPLAERHDRVKLYTDAREEIWRRWRLPRRTAMTKPAFRQALRGEFLRIGRGPFGVGYAEFERVRFVQDFAGAFR